MKNKFLIFMATITFFLTVAVVGILLKPELYESKTTVIKENDSMQSEVDEKNIESEVSNQEEWGSGDVYDGSSPIIRKMGEKLSVIGIPHRKQGDKPPMSTEVFAYWEGEMVFTVDSAVIYDSIEKTGLNYDEFVVDFSTYDSSFKPMVVQLTIENVNARLISDPPELFSDQYVLSSKEEFSKEKFRSQNGGEWRVASGMPLAYIPLIFVLAGVAARIAYVNITAEKPIIEYYSENEWAGLNGSYIRSWEENTEGYSVKIVGYEVMEKEKYFSKYDLSGKDQSVADPFAYIMEVTIKIKNEENETGKLQIADWALIGKNDDFIAYLDQQLLMDTDERVDSILSSISTASGKEIEIKLPYPLIYMDKEKEIDRNMPYKIAVTKYPSRKYIQFG